MSPRKVARRYDDVLASYGKIDVVAPISAPILQIVALPVALMVSAPDPKYSMMAPVPPLTLKRFATSRITSFGDDHPERAPLRRTPMSRGHRRLKASPVMTSMASPPPTPTAT